MRIRKFFQAAWQSAAILLASMALAFAVNHFRPGSLPLIGDWSVKGQLAMTGHGEEAVIPLQEAEVLYFAGQGVFLDARSDEAFAQAHIKGARSLPWVDFENRVLEVLADVSADSEIVTYCDGESCGLSKELALALQGMGYSRTRVLVNGWIAWQNAGLPTE